MSPKASDYESGWSVCPPGHALQQERAWKYDRQAALLYAPATFNYAEVSLTVAPPSDEWVLQAFIDFVRGEFSDAPDDIQPYPGLPDVVGTETADPGNTVAYLDACERLVYDGYLDGLLARVPDNLASQTHAVLADKRLGNHRNTVNVPETLLNDWLTPLVDGRLRLRLVMPAFPFKDQNPFRTASRASSPDFAEVAMLIHLHVVSLALYQVHPHGVDWILLSDGVIYSDIFGVDTREALAYQHRLRTWRDFLNLNNTVSIVDLGELAERVNGCAGVRTDSEPLRETVSSIRNKLLAAVDSGMEPVQHVFRVLKRGMAWNLNSRAYLEQADADALWTALKNVGRHDETGDTRLAHDIEERASVAAVEYASFNLALRYLDVVNRFLPGSVRATIHPKRGQIAAPRLGPSDVFPWNGVPVAGDNRPAPGDLVVDALHNHGRRFGPLVTTADPVTGDPFLYCPRSGQAV